MTEEELDHLRALCDAATPGPWEDGTAMCCPDMGWVDGPKGKGTICPVYEAAKRTHTLDSNDAAFIAAARTALPALIEEVKRLRGLLREAHRELSTIEAITVSPSDTDGLIALVKKIEEVL